MHQEDHRPGFFGKVATHGDFVTRRLPPTFVRTWDDWLQAGLQQSRERMGAAWLATYLCSPIWRFALAAGVCGEQAWAGVMMPSVDRVGRYFPLTLAFAGQEQPACEQLMGDGDGYTHLENLALSSLLEGFSLADFDESLSALIVSCAIIPTMHSPAQQGERWLDLPNLERPLETAGQGSRVMFWTDGSPQVAPSLLLCPTLPTAQTFADMLDGQRGCR